MFQEANRMPNELKIVFLLAKKIKTFLLPRKEALLSMCTAAGILIQIPN